jgi:hypothetical protein
MQDEFLELEFKKILGGRSAGRIFGETFDPLIQARNQIITNSTSVSI